MYTFIINYNNICSSHVCGIYLIIIKKPNEVILKIITILSEVCTHWMESKHMIRLGTGIYKNTFSNKDLIKL